LHQSLCKRKEEVEKGGLMTKSQLLKKIAVLESLNDQLSTEVNYVDHLMRLVGFSGGIATVKATAQEIIEKNLQSTEEYYL
jgi:hypothetical protein